MFRLRLLKLVLFDALLDALWDLFCVEAICENVQYAYGGWAQRGIHPKDKGPELVHRLFCFLKIRRR